MNMFVHANNSLVKDRRRTKHFTAHQHAVKFYEVAFLSVQRDLVELHADAAVLFF